MIGGELIYSQSWAARVVSTMHANEILTDTTECDTFLCDIPTYFDNELDHINSSGRVRYTRYSRQFKIEKRQYLDLVQSILRDDESRCDRIGNCTLSFFGSMRISLREGEVLLLTTKKVRWRGIVQELLWMMSGCMDAKKPFEKGVTIWGGNSPREFSDNFGFAERSVGDIGPIYGYQ
ncbi:unnamed protein product [Ectocarpus sp. 4 AP-2014]